MLNFAKFKGSGLPLSYHDDFFRMGAGSLEAFVWLPRPQEKSGGISCRCCAELLCCGYRPGALLSPHAMFPPTATPRPERSDAVEFLREGSRVTAFWDVQKEHPLPRAP